MAGGSNQQRVSAYLRQLAHRLKDKPEAPPEEIADIVSDTVSEHCLDVPRDRRSGEDGLRERLTRATDIAFLTQHVGPVKVAELLARDYEVQPAARKRPGRRRPGIKRGSGTNNAFDSRQLGAKQGVSFGRATPPDHVALLQGLVAHCEAAPERLAMRAYMRAIPTFTTLEELDTTFRGLLLRRTDAVEVPPLPEVVAGLRNGLRRLKGAGVCNAHYYAYARHIDPPERDDKTWTLFEMIDHVSESLNRPTRTVGGIQMHVDAGRDGFTLRQLINGGAEGQASIAAISQRLKDARLSLNLDCSEASDETFADLQRLVDAFGFHGTRIRSARFYLREKGNVEDIIQGRVELLVNWANRFHSSGSALAIESHEDLSSYEVLDLIERVNRRLAEAGGEARLHSKVDYGNDFNCWPASAGTQAKVLWDRVHGTDGKRRLSEADIRELNGIVVNAVRGLIDRGRPVTVDVKSIAYWDPIMQRQGQFGVPAGMGDTPLLLLTVLLLISGNECLGPFGIESQWGYSSPLRRDANFIDRIELEQQPSFTRDPVGASEEVLRRLELDVVKNDIKFFYEMLGLLHRVIRKYDQLEGR